MRILILGGTTEARELATRLAGDGRFASTLSLAGRTAHPAPQPVPTRIGGFGGPEGLKDWLRDQSINAIIDATHPYASRISANAVTAAQAAGIALGSLVRPAWQRLPGDTWIDVANAEEAVSALGATPRRVFLSMGRLEIAAFAAAPQHCYVARMIDPPKDVQLPPEIVLIQDRGPFQLAAELELLRKEAIEFLVSKNSGGSATYPKIAAAREAGIPVIMIARPKKPHRHILADIDAACAWLETLREPHDATASARGV
jgi:precorrin-6A/cobalt-precorrin-6A reductase